MSFIMTALNEIGGGEVLHIFLICALSEYATSVNMKREKTNM